MVDLTAPIIWKNDEKRIVTGPVLVPGEEDTQGDIVDKETVETVAHKFLEEYGNIDLQHNLVNVARPVESWVTRKEESHTNQLTGESVDLPAGTWMMTARVSEEVWNDKVKSGQLSGFSIMAVKKEQVKAMKEKGMDMETAIKSGMVSNKGFRKATLEELGEDFVVPAVSLVDEPAVPKAKWIAIKSKEKAKKESDEVLDLNGLNSLDRLMEKIRDRAENSVKSYLGEEGEMAPLFTLGVFVDPNVAVVEDMESDEIYKVSYRVQNMEPEVLGVERAELANLVLPMEKLEDYLPNLAEKMKQFGANEVKVDLKEISDELLEELCEKFLPEDGFFNRVMDSDIGGMEPVEKACFSAWLYRKYTEKTEEKVEEEEKQTFTGKIRKMFGFSEKAGRTISEQNMTKLKEGKEKIQEALRTVDELLRLAEEERKGLGITGNKSEEKEDDVDMTKEEIQEVVEKSLEGIKNEVNELKDKLEELEKEEVEEPEEKVDEEPEKAEEPEEPEEDELITELKSRVDELEQMLSPKAKRVFGQDDEGEDEEKPKTSIPGRDAMGRRKRTKKEDD